jgi:hypothetical protein
LATADFVVFTFPAVKIMTDDADDGEKQIVRTYNFTAQKYYGAAATRAPTATRPSSQIQDSQADHEAIAPRRPGLSACYLVGWDGIEETFTEALGLHLIRSNPHLKAQVDAIAGDLAGFTKASPKTS